MPEEIVSASSSSLFKLHLKKFDLHAIASLVFKLLIFLFFSYVSVVGCESSYHCVVT